MDRGQIVRFKDPAPEEVDDRFIVLEDRDDRVLVEYICDMTIPPTPVYAKSDLIEVK